MGLPTAEYPNYDGLSDVRTSLDARKAPDADDWDQLVAEVLAQQAASGISYTAVVTAGASTISEIAITAKDAKGVAMTNSCVFDVYLSDSAVGTGLTATTASGTVQAKAASGTVISAMVAKKYIRVMTLGTGVFTLEITDTAKTAFKVLVVNPASGKPVLVATLVTASYGA